MKKIFSSMKKFSSSVKKDFITDSPIAAVLVSVLFIIAIFSVCHAFAGIFWGAILFVLAELFNFATGQQQLDSWLAFRVGFFVMPLVNVLFFSE